MTFYEKVLEFAARTSESGGQLYAKGRYHIMPIPAPVLNWEAFVEDATHFRVNEQPWMTRAAFEALLETVHAHKNN